MDVNPGGQQTPQYGGQPPFQNPQYPHSGGRGSGRKWLWLIPVGLVIAVLPFLCCGGIGYWFYGAVQEPGKAVTEYCNSDARITDRLGSPLAMENYSFTEYVNNVQSGHAVVGFDLKGPNGSAEIAGRTELVDGNWEPTDMTVTFEDGSTLKIPGEADSARSGKGGSSNDSTDSAVD